jgi:hypothetical protein
VSVRVVLLGAQRPVANVGEAVSSLGISGPVALVTAGMQEYEDDDGELREAIGVPVVNLRLHNRGENVFGSDKEFKEAYRGRQERLRQYQDLYRIRLEHAMAAADAIRRKKTDPDLLAAEEESCFRAIRALDDEHLERCRAQHEVFEWRWPHAERASVARHRKELASMMEDVTALAIAGGHVAVLLNRLKLFDIEGMLAGRPLIAWSAGAMAISERVVLYHDSPPQGRPIAEILDTGLGLCRNVVPLTNPERRLKVDDRERVATFARRFAPASCLALGKGSRVTHDGRALVDSHGVRILRADGSAPEIESLGGTDDTAATGA